MRVNRKVFVAFIFVFLAIYCSLDYKLYYYGKSNFTFYPHLPLNIVPEFWGLQNGNLGFVLLDEGGLTLIANGSKYWSSEVVVDKILKYGFNKNQLIAYIKGKDKNNYYIICLKNNDIYSNQNVKINVSKEIDQFDSANFKWISNDESYFRKMELARNYFVLFSIVIIGILSYMLFCSQFKKKFR